jgi:hypothetical protein
MVCVYYCGGGWMDVYMYVWVHGVVSLSGVGVGISGGGVVISQCKLFLFGSSFGLASCVCVCG